MRKRIFIPLLVLLAVSCAPLPKLVILHLNDTHSHFEPERSGRNAGRGGVIERASYIDSIRTRYGKDRVLLVHGGDFGQGTSYFTLLRGEVETDMINALGYDRTALGNHEFDNGIEELTERVKKMKTEVVCSNLDLSQFELGKYVKPYTIINRGGLRIGIIGITPDLGSLVSKNISARMPQSGYVESVNKYAPLLRKECDMVILISHAGIAADRLNVPQTHCLDLVIGAHSHTFMDEMEVLRDADGRSVPMITDGCFGYNIGKIEVW